MLLSILKYVKKKIVLSYRHKLEYSLAFLFFCLSVNFNPLQAQSVTARFEHLTINQGLSQGSISTMITDNMGFMWIGTGDGLNRYDGELMTPEQILQKIREEH